MTAIWFIISCISFGAIVFNSIGSHCLLCAMACGGIFGFSTYEFFKRIKAK